MTPRTVCAGLVLLAALLVTGCGRCRQCCPSPTVSGASPCCPPTPCCPTNGCASPGVVAGYAGYMSPVGLSK